MLKNEKNILALKGAPENIVIGLPAIVFALSADGTMKWQRTSPVIDWSLTVWGDFKLITKNSTYYGRKVKFCTD